MHPDGRPCGNCTLPWWKHRANDLLGAGFWPGACATFQEGDGAGAAVPVKPSPGVHPPTVVHAVLTCSTCLRLADAQFRATVAVAP